jgi:hypothetical protein
MDSQSPYADALRKEMEYTPLSQTVLKGAGQAA